MKDDDFAELLPDERVTAETFVLAREILSSLPNTFTAPEVAVEEDGGIVFDWMLEQGHLFSVTLTPSGSLIYAGVFGDQRVRGIELYRAISG